MAVNETTPQIDRYNATYTTYSGADIEATFNGTPIGTLSGITWSVTREKAPIYTMGSPNPRSFSRGKRGIAGSLIFTVFDRPALYDMILAAQQKLATNDLKFYTRAHNVLPGFDGSEVLVNRGIVPTDMEGALDIRAGLPYYADQIPPFNITITFSNEYGNAAARSIYGVELLNEGSGASMDDIVIEETMTFVARDVGPMYRVKGAGHNPFVPENGQFDTGIAAT